MIKCFRMNKAVSHEVCHGNRLHDSIGLLIWRERSTLTPVTGCSRTDWNFVTLTFKSPSNPVRTHFRKRLARAACEFQPSKALLPLIL
jgi:hypothetical protein